MMEKSARTHSWTKDSAASRMITDIPTIDEGMTIDDVRKFIEKETRRFRTIDYLYLVDHEKLFVGVLSIKDLFRHHGKTPIREIGKKNPLIAVRPATDQERAVYLALKHKIKAIPVVDHGGVFLGVIPNDTILSILYHEAKEDLLRLAGIHHRRAFVDHVLTIPVLESIKHRIPWLLIGLGGGLVAAKIIGFFENTIQKNLILAAFIPLIVYMGDAVGTQMEAFIIRDLAVEPRLSFRRYFTKQFLTVSAIAILLGLILILVSTIVYGKLAIGFVLGISLFAAILSSVVSGLLIPYLFSRMKFDPANTSGPIATIFQDIMSILLYFGIASRFL